MNGGVAFPAWAMGDRITDNPLKEMKGFLDVKSV
jgi:hypothetical protein